MDLIMSKNKYVEGKSKVNINLRMIHTSNRDIIK